MLNQKNNAIHSRAENSYKVGVFGKYSSVLYISLCLQINGL